MIKSLPMLIELHLMLGSFTFVQISYATKYAQSDLILYYVQTQKSRQVSLR